MIALKKCLGVDLGSSTVKVVELAIDRDGPKVLNAVSAETNVDPSMPAEERRDAIAKTLRDLIKKSKISTKDAIFGLPGQKVFIRRFRLPETTPERLERIVTYEARQQIPFPVEKTDLQFQFFPIPEEKEVEVLLVAVRHDEVRDFMALVSKTGLKARAVGVSSFALFNMHSIVNRSKDEVRDLATTARKSGAPAVKRTALAGEDEEEGGPPSGASTIKKRLSGLIPIKKKAAAEEPESEAEEEKSTDAQDEFGEFSFEEVRAFVNLGAAAMDLSIAQIGDRSLLKFSRSVPSAGNDVTRSIMNNCEVASFLDAERIKKHQTRLMTFDFDMVDDSNLNRDACMAASQAMDRILSEVRRSLDFFISQPDGMAVDSIVLSGGQALLSGSAEYIEEKLTIPTSIAESIPEESGLIWRPADEQITPYVPATGLALQGAGLADIQVDFLPEERKITRDFPYRIVAILGALLLGIIGFSSQAGKDYQSKYRAEAESLVGIRDQNQAQITQAQEAQQRHNKVSTKMLRFSKAFQDRDYWIELLADIESVKPPDVMILGYQGEHDGTVTITGISQLQRSAADFNERFREILEDPREEPTLQDVVQDQGARYNRDEDTVWRFVIKFRTGDKYNLMRITPTPDPNALQQGRRGAAQGRRGTDASRGVEAANRGAFFGK